MYFQFLLWATKSHVFECKAKSILYINSTLCLLWLAHNELKQKETLLQTHKLSVYVSLLLLIYILEYGMLWWYLPQETLGSIYICRSKKFVKFCEKIDKLLVISPSNTRHNSTWVLCTQGHKFNRRRNERRKKNQNNSDYICTPKFLWIFTEKRRSQTELPQGCFLKIYFKFGLYLWIVQLDSIKR